MKVKVLKHIKFETWDTPYRKGRILEIKYWKDHIYYEDGRDKSQLVITPKDEHGFFLTKEEYRILLLGNYIKILDDKLPEPKIIEIEF